MININNRSRRWCSLEIGFSFDFQHLKELENEALSIFLKASLTPARFFEKIWGNILELNKFASIAVFWLCVFFSYSSHHFLYVHTYILTTEVGECFIYIAIVGFLFSSLEMVSALISTLYKPHSAGNDARGRVEDYNHVVAGLAANTQTQLCLSSAFCLLKGRRTWIRLLDF